MLNLTQVRERLSSLPGWSILRAFLVGLIVGPFLFGLVNGPEDYRPNLVTEAMGIGFTALIIDWIYQQRARRELRRRLKREAGSRSHDIAIAAVEWISDEKWLIGDNGILKYAILNKANLQGANLVNANLQGAQLEQANLKNAELVFAQMQDAQLLYANLPSAKLMHADLQRARLFGAIMRYALLMDANLHGAELQKTDLQNAILFNANLQGAKLQNANLLGATLHNAKLCGAILPDGERYTDSIDMEKYTNPSHHDYHDYSEILRREETLRNTY